VLWKKLVLLFVVFFCLWVFLLTLSLMGTGFKLLGGKDSAAMFDVADNPISGLMIGILATVLVQSSSTTTSIIISLVGADELSVKSAIFMVMGANIGTSVTNTIVAMGHFADQDDLRRGFSAATVHDVFNMLTVLVMLPLNWMYPWLEKMTFEMVKDQKPCEDECVKREFLKPYISPYSKGVAQYDKKVAGYVSKGYCGGECGISYTSTQMKEIAKAVCNDGKLDCGNIHPDFEDSWIASGYLYKKRAPAYITTDAAGSGKKGFTFDTPSNSAQAVKFFDANGTAPESLLPNTLYEVCGSKVKTGLCDKRLLKGGLMLDDWKMTDDGAGTFLTILSLTSLCSCLFLIVYFLQIIVKGPAARVLRAVVGFNGYVNIIIGLGITILVQSSSITTATLTPLAAVGLITLEDMLPLTLGANIGTTLTGIMGATVVTSNPVAAWQVALCHLFFNIFGILMWYPIPRVRQIPLNAARWLGRMTAKPTIGKMELDPKFGKLFPLVYTFTVFFIIPSIVYGIAVAATA
jgi:sodium-dependent phosphate cotransporter